VTIRKGEPWGGPGPLPDDGVLVRTDAEARRAVTDARRAGRAVPALGLLGGDLARTCGSTGRADRLRGSEAQRLPVDLGEVLVDGTLQQPQRDHRGHATHQRRQRVHPRRVLLDQRRPRAGDGGRGDDRHADLATHPTGERPQQQRHHDHAEHQRGLVPGTERADRPALHRPR